MARGNSNIGGVETKKIDVMLVSFILVMSLFIGLFGASRNAQAAQEPMPLNLKKARITEEEFSISWVTSETATGYIVYGTDPDDLNMTAWDDRGPSISSDTHHVRVGDYWDGEGSYGALTREEALIPGTTYYFKIVSDDVVYGDDSGVPTMDGEPWNLTIPTPTGDPVGHIVVGYVYEEDGVTEVKDALVYCTITNRTSNITSAPLSVMSVDDGGFGFNLGDARHENGSMFQWAHHDPLNIFVHAGKKGSGTAEAKILRYGIWPFQGPKDLKINLTSNQAPTINFIAPPPEGGVANASFTIKWNAYDFDDDALMDFYYDTDNNPGGETKIAGNINEEGGINGLTFDTTGFPVDAVIYAKVEISDGFNPSVAVYSTPITIDRFPPSAITNLIAQPGVNNGEVELEWTAPGDDGYIDIATSYEIRYSTALINESNWQFATDVESDLKPKEPGSYEKFLIGNLTTGQLHNFAVKTSDGASLSLISNIASSLPQMDLGPPARIYPLRAETGNQTGEVILKWNSTGDDGDVGRANHYVIKYNKSLISSANWNDSIEANNSLIPQISGTPEIFTVINLTPDEGYFFAIKAFDEGLNPSNLSNVPYAKAKIDTTSPVAITDLMAEVGHKNGEVILTWTAPGDDGYSGKARAYILKHSSDKITDLSWDDAIIIENFIEPAVAGDPQDFTVKDLVPGIEYYFAIKSMDEKPNLSPVSNSPSTKAYSDATFLIISSPKDGEVYLTTDIIVFDATNTTDADDNLNFFWSSNIDGGFGWEAKAALNLSNGSHMISLYVADEKGGFVSGSVNITVIEPSYKENGDVDPKDEKENMPLSYACMFSLFLLITVVGIAMIDIVLYIRYRKAKPRKKRSA